MKTKTADTIRFHTAQSAELVYKAKRLCHDVYLRMGYIPGAYANGIIPYAFDEKAVYIIAENETGEIVGTLRITYGWPGKILELWQGRLYTAQQQLIASAKKGKQFEIGALAVRKDQASFKIAEGLYRTAYYYCVDAGLEYGLISMDQRALRALDMVGWNIVSIGHPLEYMGSITVPAIIPIKDQPRIIAERTFKHHSHIAA